MDKHQMDLWDAPCCAEVREQDLCLQAAVELFKNDLKGQFVAISDEHQVKYGCGPLKVQQYQKKGEPIHPRCQQRFKKNGLCSRIWRIKHNRFVQALSES